MIDYDAMTDGELERICDLAVLAMAGNKDAHAELADISGGGVKGLADVYNTMHATIAAMTPRGREAMWNRDAQRMAYTPPLLPDADKTVSKIARLRRERGLTQKALAEAAGVNIRQIQKYEGGEYATGNMTISLGISIAGALGVRVEDLL